MNILLRVTVYLLVNKKSYANQCLKRDLVFVTTSSSLVSKFVENDSPTILDPRDDT